MKPTSVNAATSNSLWLALICKPDDNTSSSRYNCLARVTQEQLPFDSKSNAKTITKGTTPLLIEKGMKYIKALVYIQPKTSCQRVMPTNAEALINQPAIHINTSSILLIKRNTPFRGWISRYHFITKINFVKQKITQTYTISYIWVIFLGFFALPRMIIVSE